MRDELKLLQQAMDKAVESNEVAGATLLILEDGREKYYAQSGFADVQGNKLMERDTIHHLYSMSKPITAAAVMLLVQDGIVDLCENVGKYLPSFNNQKYVKDGQILDLPEDKPMRILDLMNMTSGLVYPGLNTEAELETGRLFEAMDEGIRSDKTISTLEFADRLGRCPLQFIPGTHFQYGTSADILGALIEVVTGVSFGEFLKERLFDPLKMKDTGFFVPAEKKSRLSKVYQTGPDGVYESPTNHLAIRYDGNKNLFESGGAGLFSTIDDYANFARMLMNGGTFGSECILKESAVKYLTSGKLMPFQQEDLYNWAGLEGFTYGNLMRVMEEPGRATLIGNKGEYGWDGWLGTYFANDPSTKMTVLMMTQMIDTGTGNLVRKLRNIVMNTK